MQAFSRSSRVFVIFILLLQGLAGCADDPGDRVIATTFDICGPVVVDASQATPAQAACLADAVAMWRARGVVGLAVTSTPASADVELRFQRAASNFHGLYDDQHGVIYVNQELSGDREACAITIAHELGHAFGLWHVDRHERVSVMNQANLTVLPNAADERALAELWGPCQSVD